MEADPDPLTEAHRPLPVPEHPHGDMPEGMASLPTSLTSSSEQPSRAAAVGSRVDLEWPSCRNVVQIDDFLSAEECTALLEGAQAHGFTDMKDEYDPEYRSGERVVVRLPGVAAALWSRLRPHLRRSDLVDVRPVGFGNEGTWKPCGINPVFRFSRYRTGQGFSGHRDGGFVLHDDCRSVYTFMIYLLTTAKGQTQFFGLHQADPYCTPIYSAHLVPAGHVEAVRGRALFFPHDTLHAGKRLARDGEDEGRVKAIVRTDIMLERIAGCRPEYALHPEFRVAQDLYNQSIQLQLEGKLQESTDAFVQALEIQAQFPSLSPRPRPYGPEHKWLNQNCFAYLMSFLDVRDIACGVALASRSWNAGANDDVVWHALYRRRFPKMAAVLGMASQDDQHVLTSGLDYRALYRNHAVASGVRFNPLVIDVGAVCTRFTYADVTEAYTDMVPYKFDERFYSEYTMETYERKSRQRILSTVGPSPVYCIPSVGSRYRGHYWHARSGLAQHIFGLLEGWDPQFAFEPRSLCRRFNHTWLRALVRWINAEGLGFRVFQKHHTRHPVVLVVPEYVEQASAESARRMLLEMAVPAVAIVPSSVAFLAAYGVRTGLVLFLSGTGMRCVAVVRGAVAHCVHTTEFMLDPDEETLRSCEIKQPSHEDWVPPSWASSADMTSDKWKLALTEAAPSKLVFAVLSGTTRRFRRQSDATFKKEMKELQKLSKRCRRMLLSSTETFDAVLECLEHCLDDDDTLNELLSHVFLAGGLSEAAEEPFIEGWRSYFDQVRKTSVPQSARSFRFENANESFEERSKATSLGGLLLSKEPHFQKHAFTVQ